jgi:hypothetical protein
MDLFLVHSGAVGTFLEDPLMPTEDDSDPFAYPHAVYTQGWFMNREMLAGAPTRHTAVALSDGEVLVWTERNWIKMAREKPYMARAISRMIIKQQSRDDELQSLEMAANVMTTVDRPIDMIDDEELDMTWQNSLRNRKSTKGRASLSTDQPPLPKQLRRVSDVIKESRMFGITPSHSTSASSRPGCPFGLGLPEEMIHKLIGIQTAQVLEGFNLYTACGDTEDAAEAIVLPPMPKGFRQNVEIAFRTFCNDKEEISWLQMNKC